MFENESLCQPGLKSLPVYSPIVVREDERWLVSVGGRREGSIHRRDHRAHGSYSDVYVDADAEDPDTVRREGLDIGHRAGIGAESAHNDFRIGDLHAAGEAALGRRVTQPSLIPGDPTRSAGRRRGDRLR